MRLNTKDFKEVCKIILLAVGNKDKDSTLFSETLELKSNGNTLSLNVTDRQYYVSVDFDLEDAEEFHASVEAKLFLTLVSKLTSDTMEMTVSDNFITIKSDGEYKIPVIFNNNSMVELPQIVLNNVTCEMGINSNILRSIVDFNTRELQRGMPTKRVREYYYVDEKGALTCTTGACDNRFTLSKPVKMLLPQKVVKLFKLFKSDTNVDFKLGNDPISNDVIQTKVRFSANNVTLTAILYDLDLIGTFPADSIREMSDAEHKYSVVVSRLDLVQSLQRVILLNSGRVDGKFELVGDTLTVYNCTGDSNSTIPLISSHGDEPYEMVVSLEDFEKLASICDEEYLTIEFGDHRSIIVKTQDVINIIPELKKW